jgi:Predicted membrane protein (DUF2207)
MVALPIIFALIFLLARARDHPPGLPKELDEPPEDMHPVDLAILWSAFRHHVSARTAYRAEVIHLARIGAISLVPVGRVSEPTDFEIRFEREPDDELDREFVTFLFPADGAGGERTPLTLRSLRRSSPRGEPLRTWWAGAFGRVGSAVVQILLDMRPEFLLAFVVGVFVTPILMVSLAPDFARIGLLPLLLLAMGGAGWLFMAWALPPRLHPELRERVQRVDGLPAPPQAFPVRSRRTGRGRRDLGDTSKTRPPSGSPGGSRRDPGTGRQNDPPCSMARSPGGHRWAHVVPARVAQRPCLGARTGRPQAQLIGTGWGNAARVQSEAPIRRGTIEDGARRMWELCSFTDGSPARRIVPFARPRGSELLTVTHRLLACPRSVSSTGELGSRHTGGPRIQAMRLSLHRSPVERSDEGTGTEHNQLGRSLGVRPKHPSSPARRSRS